MLVTTVFTKYITENMQRNPFLRAILAACLPTISFKINFFTKKIGI